jgi:hypothetical protein
MKMNFFKNRSWLTIFAVILIVPVLVSWGVYGHEHINRAAVLALPAPLQAFFYNHIDFITQESSVPDLRKYTLNDNAEKPRHFIDIENFGAMDSMPATLAEAKKKYDEKFLQQNGILPWYIEEMMDKLTKAFKEKRKTEILFLAADLGHYIGDAHMPLHTSVNHNGQLTNQKGIHAFWESRLPEMFGDNYDYNVGNAVYITDIPKETWRMINATHLLVDTLLLADKELKEQFPADKIYMKDDAGNILKNKFNEPMHSVEYSRQYNQKLKGMVESQMRLAITATANFWYTAWVNAGKPDLSDLDPTDQTERNKSNLQRELKSFKQGKLVDIQSEKEF